MSAASTYADALFRAARERNELEGVLEDLNGFVETLEESEELRLFFFSTQIAEREKRRAIDALTENMRLSTRNFLKVLSDNGRAEIIPDVARRYEELVEEHLGRVEVQLVTAVEMSEETLDSLKDRLGRILEGREVVLETSVNPELLGGAVFRFDGSMVDGSIRGQLESLRKNMTERGVA